MTRRLVHLFLAGLLWAVARVLRTTWRVRVAGRLPDEGCLLVYWHGHQLALTGRMPARRIAVLVSRSADGEIAAGCARLLGLEAERGSSHRGAVAASRALVRRLRSGQTVGIAADGPRGPRERCGSSAARVAVLAGRRAIPLAAVASRGLRLSSWDAMVIPAPFAKVQIVVGDAVAGVDVQGALEQTARRALAQMGGG